MHASESKQAVVDSLIQASIRANEAGHISLGLFMFFLGYAQQVKPLSGVPTLQLRKASAWLADDVQRYDEGSYQRRVMERVLTHFRDEYGSRI